MSTDLFYAYRRIIETKIIRFILIKKTISVSFEIEKNNQNTILNIVRYKLNKY